MTSQTAPDLKLDFEAFPSPRSGRWSADVPMEWMPAPVVSLISRAFGAAVLFIASSSTTMAIEVWGPDRRRETSAILCVQYARKGRRISLQEARNIALQILTDAEDRRIRFAEAEASVYSVWEWRE